MPNQIQLKDAEQDQEIALLKHRVEELEEGGVDELRQRVRKLEKTVWGASAVVAAAEARESMGLSKPLLSAPCAGPWSGVRGRQVTYVSPRSKVTGSLDRGDGYPLSWTEGTGAVLLATAVLPRTGGSEPPALLPTRKWSVAECALASW